MDYRLPRSTLFASLCALLLLVSTVLLTGCTALPSDTPPQSLGQFRRASTNFTPPKPKPGRSLDGILRDFLKAAALPTDRHAAARLFFTPQGGAAWDDRDTVKIVDRIDINTLTVPDATSRVVQVRARSIGALDTQGIFRSALSNHTFEVEMRRVGQQWLIEKFPDELFVDREAFMSAYEPHALYYLDPTGSRVVPDLRWLFPQDNELPATLMQLLRKNPAPQLRAMVLSELPAAARISASTDVQGNGIDVEISNYQPGSPASRQRLAAQIIFTFEYARIHGPFYITVDGKPLDPNHRDGWTVADVTSYDPMRTTNKNPLHLHAITANGLMNVGYSLEPVKGPAGSMQNLRAASFSRGGGMIGVVEEVRQRGGTSLRVQMGRTGGTLVPVLRGTRFSRPTWDPTGQEMWVAAGGSRIERVMWNGGRSPLATRVDTSALPRGTTIDALAISPDGVRLAYISEGKLYIAAIFTSREGEVAIKNPQRIYISGDDVALSLAWSTSTELFVGGSFTNQPILTVSVDGASITPLSSRNITAPVSVIVANPNGVYVQDSREVMRLERMSESIWQDVPALVDSPHAIPVLEG